MYLIKEILVSKNTALEKKKYTILESKKNKPDVTLISDRDNAIIDCRTDKHVPNVCFRKSSWNHPGVHAGKEHCFRLKIRVTIYIRLQSCLCCNYNCSLGLKE